MKPLITPCKKIVFGLIAASALALGFIENSHAATINFSTTYYGGIPATFKDGNDDWWNTPLPWPSSSSISGGSVTNALDETGTATSVSLTVDKRFEGYFNTGPTSSTLGYDSLISRNGVYIGSTHSSAIITLSGLDSEQFYNLTLYASVGANGSSAQDRRMLVDLLGESASPQTSLNVYSTATVPDENVVVFESVRPDADGEIRLTFSYESYPGLNRGHLNAISITPVPEPGSVAFFLAGAASMVIFMRKRMNR